MEDIDDGVDYYPSPQTIFETMMHVGGLFIDCSSDATSSPDLSPIRKRSVSPEGRKGETEISPLERFKGNTNFFELASKNAAELIEEEEAAKVKAAKKRAKKQRQKLKKQLSKENNLVVQEVKENSSIVLNNDNRPNVTSNISSDVIQSNIPSAPENKETQELDIEAAFVSKAIKKIKNAQTISNIVKSEKNKTEKKDIKSLIKQAQEYEKKQHYKEALKYISEAINLMPQSIDLILNRSFLHFQLAKFEKSVRDAKKVIQLSPNNPHAYYRLGEGYFALSNLSEAEAAYINLLTLNSYCDEANNRIFSIRIKQLEEMGYHPNESFAALSKSKSKTLEEALVFFDELEKGEHVDELYYSDEEEDEEEEKSSESACGPSTSSSGNFSIKPTEIEITNKSPILTNPKNPLGCSSLFIGSLKKDITYEELDIVFRRFGNIKSIKLSTDTNCYAFINYEKSESAGQAMEELQGSRWLLSTTTPLVIKYPLNVIKNMISKMKTPELIMDQLVARPPPPANRPKPVNVASGGCRKKQMPVVQKPDLSKPRPHLKTEECFYWRTMGCSYGDKCFNLHIPEHRGIEKIPKIKIQK